MLVQGTGAVGLSAIALARLARRLDDLRHRRAGRLGSTLAREMGADVVVRPRRDDRPTSGSRRCATLTHGEGVDVVIEAAGSAARDRGRA